MSPPELDELVGLYQRVSAQLSYARGQYRDPTLTARLTALVAGAHGVIYGKRTRTLRAVVDFLAVTFPTAVWESRRFVAASAALLLVPALAMGVWIGRSDEALDASGPEAAREAYVERDFEAYYSSAPAAEFATFVTVNNIRVSIAAFAFGALLCIGAAIILVVNGANVGVAAGVFAASGESGRFFGLILPHGLLELTAVAIAGAAGLRIGWAIIAPGDRTRGRAMAHEGRRAFSIILGLVGAFVIAGTIEGFITGSGLSTALRVGVGVAVEVAFLTYIVQLGRRGEASVHAAHDAFTAAPSPSP